MNENFKMPTDETVMKELEKIVYEYFYYTALCNLGRDAKVQRHVVMGKWDAFADLFGLKFAHHFVHFGDADEIIARAKKDAKELVDKYAD